MPASCRYWQVKVGKLLPFRSSVWGFFTVESNDDRSIAGLIITGTLGKITRLALTYRWPFCHLLGIVSEEPWRRKKRGRKRERETGRTVVLRIVHGVIRHGRELTTTTFHPNHVIDVRDARFFSPISRYYLMLYVVTAYRRVFACRSLHRRTVIPDCHATGHHRPDAECTTKFFKVGNLSFALKDMRFFLDNKCDIYVA